MVRVRDKWRVGERRLSVCNGALHFIFWGGFDCVSQMYQTNSQLMLLEAQSNQSLHDVYETRSPENCDTKISLNLHSKSMV